MQLSKLSYYSDFVVYPPVIVALAAAECHHVTWVSGTEWLGAAVAGLVLWTLMEYVLHRIALHECPIFRPCTASITPRRWPSSARRRGSA